MSDARDRILEIYVEQDWLSAELQGLITKLQAECPHTHVVELGYTPESVLFHASPPRLICINRSLEEEGWSRTTNPKLDSSKVLKTVSREEFSKLRKIQRLVPVHLPADL